MVDNYNPTNQFHPYTPVDATPNSVRASGGLGRFLKKTRGMAQKNPSAVLGGLAALVIGAGLMRQRNMTR